MNMTQVKMQSILDEIRSALDADRNVLIQQTYALLFVKITKGGDVTYFRCLKDAQGNLFNLHDYVSEGILPSLKEHLVTEGYNSREIREMLGQGEYSFPKMANI